MFGCVVLGTSLLLLILTLKKKKNKQTNEDINTGILKQTTHEEYLIEDLSLRLRSAFQSSYSCKVLQSHNIRITTF